VNGEVDTAANDLRRPPRRRTLATRGPLTSSPTSGGVVSRCCAGGARRSYELAAWHDNGTEQDAEIIAWGVYDGAAPVFIDHHGCDEPLDGYRTLTGTDTQ